jgi:hypothetical protein
MLAKHEIENLKRRNHLEDRDVDDDIKLHLFSVAKQPVSVLGRLIVEVSRSHTIRHTHPVEPL